MRGGGGETIAALSPSDAAAPPPCFVGSEAVKGCLRGVRLDFSTMLTGLCGSHSTGPADAVPSDILPADGPRLVIESVFSHHIAAALPAKRRRRKKKSPDGFQQGDGGGPRCFLMKSEAPCRAPRSPLFGCYATAPWNYKEF